MSNLYINETYVNMDENAKYGSSGVYEAFTDDPGQLFRSCQREFGKCVSSMYTDEGGKTRKVGWVFQARAKYDDSKETYMREVWVSLHTSPDTVTVEKNYYELED